MSTNTYAASSQTDDLEFVFARVERTLLTLEEEQKLSRRIWARREALLELLSPSTGSLPATTRVATESSESPLLGGVAKQLVHAERSARRTVEDERATVTNSVLESLEESLAIIDRAKEKLVHHNLRLVVWVAKRFQRKGLDFSDLFQEGCIALMEAVERFDPFRGNRLSTYAARAVHLGIVRALAEKGRMIRIPLHRLKEVVDVSKAWTELRNKLGREPTEDEISSRAGIAPEEISALTPALRPMSSFDATIPGTDWAYADILADQGLVPSEQAEASERRALASRALKRLPERERRILQLRYGLDGGDERTFEAIGQDVGLSRERSRQLERVALGRMETALRAREKGVRSDAHTA